MSPSALAIVIAASLTGVTTSASAQTTPPPAGTSTTPAAPKKDPAKPKSDKDAKPADAATTPTSTTTAKTAEAKADAKPEPKPEAEADDEKEDKNAIYLSGDIGFTRADVGAFSDTTGFDKTGANGLLAGFGLGYRRSAFRFGARFRDHATTEFSLWAIMGEIGYALKMRPVSPTFFVHLGYMFDAGVDRGAFEKKLPAGNFLTPDIDLNGVIVGGEVSAAYWLSHNLRVSPFLGFDVTVLHRSQPSPPQTLFQLPDSVRNNALFGESGDGLGYVLSIGLRLTADIGIDAAFASKKADPEPAK